MSRFQQKFESINQQYFKDRPRPKEADAPERYILRGDAAAWNKIKPKSLVGWGHDLSSALGDPRHLDDADRRAIQVLVLACGDFALGRWLNGHLQTERANEDLFGLIRAALMEQPRTAGLLLPWTGQSVTCWEVGRRVTSAGRFLLALPEADLGTVVKHSGSYAEANPGSRIELIEFLFKHAPKRLPALGESLFAKAGDTVNGEVAELLMDQAPSECGLVVAAFVGRTKDLWTRFAAASKLAEWDADEYYPTAEKIGLAVLRGKANSHVPGQYGSVTSWLLQHGGEDLIPKIAACMTNPDPSAIEFDEILSESVAALGQRALPIVRASLELDEYKGRDGTIHDPFTSMYSRLRHLLAIKEAEDDELIVGKIPLLLASPQCSHAMVIEMALGSRIPAAAEMIWGLSEHPTKPVREAAASALAKLGDTVIPKAETLLRNRKAEVREMAIRILIALATPQAIAVLLLHLDDERTAKLSAMIRAALPEAKRAPAKRKR